MATWRAWSPRRSRRPSSATVCTSNTKRGRITAGQFYESFCQRTGHAAGLRRPPPAGNDIFTLNAPLLPVVSQLAAAGYRLGILSNACEGHWEHCRRRYRILAEDFSVYALSFRIGACKPRRRSSAPPPSWPAAGRRPFSTSTTLPATWRARAVGLDAVQYTTPAELVEDLRKRGVEFNY